MMPLLRWERLNEDGRGIKNSVLHMLNLRLRSDKWRVCSREFGTGAGSIWLAPLVPSYSAQKWPDTLYRIVSPPPIYPLSLSFCFLVLRSSYYHRTHCLHFCSLPISPATRIPPSLAGKPSILLTAVSPPEDLTCNKCSLAFVKWMEQVQESFKWQPPR